MAAARNDNVILLKQVCGVMLSIAGGNIGESASVSAVVLAESATDSFTLSRVLDNFFFLFNSRPKALDGFAETFPQLRQFPGAEHKQSNSEDNEQMYRLKQSFKHRFSFFDSKFIRLRNSWIRHVLSHTRTGEHRRTSSDQWTVSTELGPARSSIQLCKLFATVDPTRHQEVSAFEGTNLGVGNELRSTVVAHTGQSPLDSDSDRLQVFGWTRYFRLRGASRLFVTSVRIQTRMSAGRRQ